MADLKTIKAAPTATVVEAAAPIGSMPLWTLYHYEYGNPIGKSLARGDEIGKWLDDLAKDGRVIGFGWEIRGHAAPADWPGWPVDRAQETSSETAAHAGSVWTCPSCLDSTCGDCIEGRCHGSGPCGCARHEASVQAQQLHEADADEVGGAS